MLKFIGYTFLTLITLLVLTFFLLPWKNYVSTYLLRELQTREIPVTALTLDSITTGTITFSTITLALPGQDLTIPSLRVSYHWADGFKPQLHDVTLADIDYTLPEGEASATQEASQSNALPPALWDTALFHSLPVQQVHLRNITLRLNKADHHAVIPLNGELALHDIPTLTLNTGTINYSSGSNQLTLASMESTLMLEGNAWQGNITATGIEARLSQGHSIKESTMDGIFTLRNDSSLSATLNAPFTLIVAGEKATSIPASLKAELTYRGNLKGQLTLSAQEGEGNPQVTAWLPATLTTHFTLKDQRFTMPLDINSNKGTFNATYHYDTDKKTMKVTGLRTALAKGTVTADTIDLSKPDHITTTLHFKGIDLEEMIRLILGDKGTVQATGHVSGDIPVAFIKQKLVIETGSLKATENGTIAINSPTIAQVGNEQTTLVQQILQNLHYKMLEIHSVPQENGKIKVHLKIEGKNPDVYNGRAVHLNVAIGGDIKETLMGLLDVYAIPETLIKHYKDLL